MGVALAAVVAVAMGHLGDEVHPGKVSAAMGVYVAGNTLGGVVGRLLPGAALDFGSWRFALLMFVAFAALAIVAFLVLLPRPQRFTACPRACARSCDQLAAYWPTQASAASTASPSC